MLYKFIRLLKNILNIFKIRFIQAQTKIINISDVRTGIGPNVDQDQMSYIGLYMYNNDLDEMKYVNLHLNFEFFLATCIWCDFRTIDAKIIMYIYDKQAKSSATEYNLISVYILISKNPKKYSPQHILSLLFMDICRRHGNFVIVPIFLGMTGDQRLLLRQV